MNLDSTQSFVFSSRVLLLMSAVAWGTHLSGSGRSPSFPVKSSFQVHWELRELDDRDDELRLDDRDDELRLELELRLLLRDELDRLLELEPCEDLELLELERDELDERDELELRELLLLRLLLDELDDFDELLRLELLEDFEELLLDELAMPSDHTRKLSQRTVT